MADDLHARRMALPGCFTDRRRSMPCMDCSVDTFDEFYMVDHDLWHHAVGHRAGYLCIGCLELRIDRRLRPDDFLPCPCNDNTWRKTNRLIDRMTYPR